MVQHLSDMRRDSVQGVKIKDLASLWFYVQSNFNFRKLLRYIRSGYFLWLKHQLAFTTLNQCSNFFQIDADTWHTFRITAWLCERSHLCTMLYHNNWINKQTIQSHSFFVATKNIVYRLRSTTIPYHTVCLLQFGAQPIFRHILKCSDFCTP